MTATSIQIAPHYPAPSACLALSWVENPYRPVTLWEMLQVHAERFVTLLADLGMLEVQFRKGTGFANKGNTAALLGLVHRHCEALNLISATKQAEKIENAIRRFAEGGSTSAPSATQEEFTSLVTELRRRIEEDMEESVFFQVPAKQIGVCFTRSRDHGATHFTWKTPDEFFGDAASKFPSARFDMQESIRCLSTEMNTACVFHLMRVLELGLTALGAVFGVSLAHTNWAPAIDQIESKVRDMHKDPVWKILPDCKEQQEFYAQAASHFGVLKDAWRNYTAHARGKYDEREALDIINSVRACMYKLATRLHE